MMQQELYITKTQVMLQSHLYELDQDLVYVEHKETEDSFVVQARLPDEPIKCPFCGFSASHVDSRYTRTCQDIPLCNKQMKVVVISRKMACYNPYCEHDTFLESFRFIERNARRTNRLDEEILICYHMHGSGNSHKILTMRGIKVSRKTIYEVAKRKREIFYDEGEWKFKSEMM